MIGVPFQLISGLLSSRVQKKLHMKVFNTFVHSILLATEPALIAYPLSETPSIREIVIIPDLRSLSYDEAIKFLSLIESDSFEERCSEEQLDQINEFVAFLAMGGSSDAEQLELLQDTASLFDAGGYQYTYTLGDGEVITCKSWTKKHWDRTRSFVKKHKKAIIVGAIVVVAVAVVVVAAVAISSSAAGAVAAGGAASVGALDSGAGGDSSSTSFTSSLQEEISSFKETVAPEQLAAILESNDISIEENGRIIGSVFAHKALDNVASQAARDPHFAQELQNLSSYYTPTSWTSNSADYAFSTDYTSTCVGNDIDLNTLIYQTRGDWALDSGYYTQAAQDFGNAIEIEPNNASSYLGRGVANFELGHYEASVADYNAYVARAAQSFSVIEFSKGFARGLPHGIYDSGEGFWLFVTDLACHPIQTSEQVYQSLAALSTLAKAGEWGQIAGAISPEIRQLIMEWDSLSFREKGELSGYAFGKHGADLFIPGATATVVAKGSAAAKELGVICKNLQSAEKLLVLEAVAEGGTAGINIREVVISANRTLAVGEDLGFTTKEIAALKQSGELEQVIGKGRDFFAGNPEMQTSYDLFKAAQENLKPYVKQAMPETEVRDLIHQSGIATFQRPPGIPDHYLVRITDKGAGMEYVHPNNKDLSVRVMPGKPHSPNSLQQKTYVVQMVGKKALDNNGNLVNPKLPEAHIPLDEFIYKEEVNCVSQ